MNKISLIIQREYITRIRKKSFLIMLFIGPLLFAALIILPGMLTSMEDKEVLEIAVVEYDTKGQPVPSSQQFFRDVIHDKENMKFVYLNNANLQDILRAFDAAQYDGVLFLSQNLISAGKDANVELYYRKPTGIGLESHISNSIEKFLFENKLIVKNVPPEIIQSLETKVHLSRINWKSWPNKEEDITDVKRGLGYVSGFLIYLFIFMFGAMVMRGILEEKTSRVIEVIISSVSPFQLMMGKIIGVGLIGLTQFVAWLILTIGITTIAQQAFLAPPAKASTEYNAPMDIMNSDQKQSMQNNMPAGENQTGAMVNSIIKQIKQVNIPLVVGAFVFYFLGGYLLYGSLFAAIGAAVDSETDTQQFMLPITIPLVLAFVVMVNTFLNPSGKLAIWFSIIPLTSPVVMIARIPFEVPLSQLLASAAALIATFLATTWMAAKIYRTGILMYGKKVTYRELWKWMRY